MELMIERLCEWFDGGDLLEKPGMNPNWSDFGIAFRTLNITIHSKGSESYYGITEENYRKAKEALRILKSEGD